MIRFLPLAATVLCCLVASTAPARTPAAPARALGAAERSALAASGVVSDALLERMPRSGRIPVMITYDTPLAASANPLAAWSANLARGDEVLATLSREEFRQGHRFQTLPLLAGELDSRGLARLAADPRVRWIEPALGGRGALAESIPLTATDTVKNFGFSGNGVRVAVLDSGVDRAHPDLSGVVVEERCWCSGGGGCCPNSQSTDSGIGAADDDNGHGTHITGMIASNGSVAPPGAAPGVEVVAIKVLDANNTFSTDTDVLAALDWLNAESIAQGSNYVDVVNLSLETAFVYGRPCNVEGEPTTSPPWDNAITQLTDRGILVVVAAGNRGIGAGAPAPACVEESFSVAASYDADIGTKFWVVSGGTCTDTITGPDVWTCGTNAFDNPQTGAKTDLVAPGSAIISSFPGGITGLREGSSQSAALVAGCAALVIEANASDPTRTLADLEADLRTSGVPPIVSTRAAFGSSFPRLDCTTAVPEPAAAVYSFAAVFSLFVLCAAARRASPARHPARCPSR